MSPEKSPGWLPDGWIMEIRRTKSGTKYKYYTSPVSGYTFRTKREVMHYLNIVKVEGHASRTTSFCLGDSKKKLVAQVKDSPDWLPKGWILEIKTRMSGANAGQKYKCYFDPLTGSRFYSKREVFQYLKAGKLPTPSSDQKRLFSTNSMDNVIAQVQYSPDGLPHGWIKEIKFRKSNKYSKVRRDPYYTDPVTGYTFRSINDVYLYLETGEVSKNAIRSQRRRISDMYSLEKESPPPISAKKMKSHGTAVRRCLFTGQLPNSDGKMAVEIDGSHEPAHSTPPEHASQWDEGADLICLPPSNGKHVEGKAKKRRRNPAKLATEESSKPSKFLKGKAKKEKKLEPATENLEEPANHLERKAKKGRKKLLEQSTKNEKPVTEKPLDEIPPDSSNTKQLELENGVQDEHRDVKGFEPEIDELIITENNLLVPVTETSLDEMPPDSSDTNQLELENEKQDKDEVMNVLEPEVDELLLTESNPLEPVSENPFQPENEKSLPPEEKQSQPERVVSKRGSKTKKPKPLTFRSSRRLAGLEAVTPPGFEIGGRPRKSIPTKRSDQLKDTVVSEKPDVEEPLGKQDISEIEVDEVGKQAFDWPESPLRLQFGDSWLDPCLEFAFKTLTGDIPVLDDTAAIEGYFQQHIISIQSSSPGATGSPSVTFGSPESCSQSKIPVQLEPLDKSTHPNETG